MSDTEKRLAEIRERSAEMNGMYRSQADSNVDFLLAEIERLNEDGRVIMVENTGLRATVSRLNARIEHLQDAIDTSRDLDAMRGKKP